MTFVNMERIEKRFNNQSVLRDVSLKMNRGFYYWTFWFR